MENSLPIISVIVPVYDVEKYLRTCIDSILAQTFTRWECILIDDGSPDNCGAICEEYAARDRRIKVLHQANGGVTLARRKGVESSRGEWITFVDSDDSLPPTALADLWAEAESGNYDIVMGTRNSRGMWRYPNDEYTAEDYRVRLLLLDHVMYAPFAKLFAKKLFNDSTLDIPRTITIGEDFLMNLRLAFANHRPVRTINKVVYSYLIRDDSVSHKHVWGYDGTGVYYSLLVESIPKDEMPRYKLPLVEGRLNGLFAFCHLAKKNVWHDTPYFNRLMADVRDTGWPKSAPFFLRLKLQTTNKALFFLYGKAQLVVYALQNKLLILGLKGDAWWNAMKNLLKHKR